MPHILAECGALKKRGVGRAPTRNVAPVAFRAVPRDIGGLNTPPPGRRPGAHSGGAGMWNKVESILLFDICILDIANEGGASDASGLGAFWILVGAFGCLPRQY